MVRKQIWLIPKSYYNETYIDPDRFKSKPLGKGRTKRVIWASRILPASANFIW